LPHAPEGGSKPKRPSRRSKTIATARKAPIEESLPPLVRIWGEDNGIGIPDHVRPRLFGIFQRFNDGYEGTGIGLAIVRKVTERMGGRVGVESTEGQGSRFWVQLRHAGG